MGHSNPVRLPFSFYPFLGKELSFITDKLNFD